MSEEKILRCPDCNTLYSDGSKTCRSCGRTLPSAKEVFEQDNLHGMPIKDWHAIIGQGADYFVELFRKNKDKKFFLSINPRAIIYGAYWFFYKKMYKGALLTYFLTTMMTLFFTLVGVAIQLSAMNMAVEDYRPYTRYKNFDGSITQEFPVDDELHEVDHAYGQLKSEIYKCVTKAALIGLIGYCVTKAFCMLSADWFYREHILNKTVRKKGYVITPEISGSTIGSVALVAMLGELFIIFIGSLLSAFLLFLLSGINL